MKSKVDRVIAEKQLDTLKEMLDKVIKEPVSEDRMQRTQAILSQMNQIRNKFTEDK